MGAGNIAPFHIEAAKEVGFDVVSISASLKSNSAYNLSKKYRIKNYFDKTQDLLTSNTFDCLAILTPPSITYKILQETSHLNLPILVEKPVAISSNLLTSFIDNNKIFVGYNRRFYKTISELNIVNKTNQGIFRFTAIEAFPKRSLSFSDIQTTILNNTVHIFDLIIYLIGDPKLRNAAYSEINNSLSIQIFSKNSFRGTLDINFNSRANTSIEFQNSIENIKISPLEKLLRFNHLKVIEPDDKHSFRSYFPINTNNAKQSEIVEDGFFKPGFISQYQNFIDYCAYGIESNLLPKISDAQNTLVMAEEICNLYKDFLRSS
jgi:predicted dehydrogenase